MSDKDAIIRVLKKVEGRVRSNRLLHELALGAALFLVVPVSLKLWDLVSPLRAVTITVALVVWLAVFAGYVVSRALLKGTLDYAAISIDQTAGLHDEIKTAFWFIHHPFSSRWIDAQIARAARQAEALDLKALYPRTVPRVAYLAAGLVLTFVALNFLPLPLNYNWLMLQAAPVHLSAQQQIGLKQLEQFLEMKSVQDPKLAERVEPILRRLRNENLDATQASALLRELQSLLEERSPEGTEMSESLQEMARDFQQSEQLKQTGDAMMDNELREAAERLRNSADQMKSQAPESMKAMQESLERASENATRGLEPLSQNLTQASESIKDQDLEDAQESLEKAANELENLEDQLKADEAAKTTRRQLQDLQQLFEDQQSQQAQNRGAGGQKQGQVQQGSRQSKQPSTSSDAKSSTQSSNSKSGAGNSEQAQGHADGPNTSGEPTNAPREGAPTSLDVMLKREQLSGMPIGGSKPQDIQEVSRQQRSTLSYRNVDSDLSASQKDLLNQSQIPWEYRPLIKNYFQAIRPDVKQ